METSTILLICAACLGAIVGVWYVAIRRPTQEQQPQVQPPAQPQS